jgi:NADH-quinone oxidoreductase subunit G
VSLEGRAQLANRAAFAPGEAREDWAILRALSDVLGQRLPFDSLNALRQRLYAEHPHFARLDDIVPADVAGAIEALGALGGQPSREPFVSPIGDFYLTNPIARASGVMAECSALARGAKLEAAE